MAKYKVPIQLWTIGHSTRSAEAFLALLAENKIEALADVRLLPGSRRFPQFNAENLQASLARVNITYFHFPELGGRRKPLENSPNTGWRHAAFRGYADHMAAEVFEKGIARLLALAKERRTAIMCAEALWWQCHRRLISDFFTACGDEMIHIMAAGKTQIHPLISPARLIDGKLSYVTAETELELPFNASTSGR